MGECGRESATEQLEPKFFISLNILYYLLIIDGILMNMDIILLQILHNSLLEVLKICLLVLVNKTNIFKFSTWNCKVGEARG